MWDNPGKTYPFLGLEHLNNARTETSGRATHGKWDTAPGNPLRGPWSLFRASEGVSELRRGLRPDERLDRGQHLVLGQGLVERVGRGLRLVAQPDRRSVTGLDLDD